MATLRAAAPKSLLPALDQELLCLHVPHKLQTQIYFPSACPSTWAAPSGGQLICPWPGQGPGNLPGLPSAFSILAFLSSLSTCAFPTISHHHSIPLPHCVYSPYFPYLDHCFALHRPHLPSSLHFQGPAQWLAQLHGS